MVPPVNRLTCYKDRKIAGFKGVILRAKLEPVKPGHFAIFIESRAIYWWGRHSLRFYIFTACSFSIKGHITGKLAFYPEEEIGRK